MAFQIDKPTNFGGHALYRRVGVWNIHPRTNTVTVVMDGYLDQATRDAGAQPAASVAVDVPYADVVSNAVFNQARSALYGYLKNLPGWAGSVDV